MPWYIPPSLGCPAPVPWKTFECRWEVPVCPTFTETAIIPKKYWRIITALKYLKYLLQMLPDSFSSQAMRDPINLALSGKLWTLQTCHSTLNLTALTPQNIDDTIKSVNWGLANHLQQIIDTFPKSYLLTGHMELDNMGKFSFHCKTQSLGSLEHDVLEVSDKFPIHVPNDIAVQ